MILGYFNFKMNFFLKINWEYFCDGCDLFRIKVGRSKNNKKREDGFYKYEL